MAGNEGLNMTKELSVITPLSGNPLLPILLLSLTAQRFAPKTKKSFRKEYDYVIVGGGTSGSVVANRLSEMPCVSVLVLEAGGPPPAVAEIPAIARELIGSEVDWKFRSTPLRYTGAAHVNRQLPLPSGKMLGGTSGMSSLFAVRGNRRGYDEWAARGATGWSYDELLPYFLKLEDYTDPIGFQNGFHNVSGPVTISKSTFTPAEQLAGMDAAASLGYKFIDSNGPSQTGFFKADAVMRRGQRCSAAKAYLVPADDRRNLDILVDVRVTKIIIDNNRQADGVEFEMNGYRHFVRARREVILAAGAMNTAQLLMLSGVGPRSELNRHGIPVIADLPVGFNFQDAPIAMSFHEVSGTIQKFEDTINDRQNILRYINYGQGPLTSTEGIVLAAFLSKNGTNPTFDAPDFLFYFFEALSAAVTGLGLKPNVAQQYFGPYVNKRNMVCAVQALHPRSTGTVTLQSRDPFASVVVDPNYYADPRDLEEAVLGMKFCSKFMSTPAMQNIGTKPYKTVMPGCEPYVRNEDMYIRCMVQSLLCNQFHYVGTAKMGDPNDPTTVVDPQLRVKTIRNLRVVDASVMPSVPWGTDDLPKMMVAEKASDMIRSSIMC